MQPVTGLQETVDRLCIPTRDALISYRTLLITIAFWVYNKGSYSDSETVRAEY